MYHSWVSCKGATHLPQILTKSYTSAYFVSKLVSLRIKSHEKYQSIFLDRLGRVERAYGEKRSILGHNRSHWRELRPLVTPWTSCIKEGTEPWKNQKWSVTSHVQVLLLFLICIFTCRGFFMTLVMNTNLVIKIAKVKSSLSLSSG